MIEITIIAGTTASGKSDLALKLATRIGGTIINADSVQLYRDLPILNASPNADEKALVPHRLYNVLEPHEPATAADYIRRLDGLMRQAPGPLILVGGTGLYLKSMIEGLAPIPDIDDDTRASVRQLSPDQCRTHLEKEDPVIADRLAPGDSQRNMRALEVIRSTGRSLASWQTEPNRQILPPFRWRGISLLPDRTILRQRIRTRMHKMMDNGALDEVETLRERVGDPLRLPINKTHGLLELCQLLDGTIGREQAIEQTAIKVGQYAKRQSTWFRHQLPELAPLEIFGEHGDTLGIVDETLERGGFISSVTPGDGAIKGDIELAQP